MTQHYRTGFRHHPVASAGLVVAVALLALAGCASEPVPAPKVNNSYLVLLEDSDGTTGQVRFTTAQGDTVLSRPLQATRLGGPGNTTFDASQAQVAQDFGGALAALPLKAQSFLLYFQAGRARLTPESEALVPRILQAIAARPVPDISVTGHTDTAGDEGSNTRLGLDRAQFVARVLGAAQLDPARVLVASHGEKNRLVQTADNTPEPRNRRVEVTIR